MNQLNPELENQVQALAEICCDVLKRKSHDASERAKPLIEALVAGGYARLSDINLQARLEKAALKECAEPAIHRRDELSGITGEMQSKFDELVKWKTQTPREPGGAKAANISSATDA